MDDEAIVLSLCYCVEYNGVHLGRLQPYEQALGLGEVPNTPAYFVLVSSKMTRQICKMTFNIMTLGIMTLGIMTLGIMTLGIMTLRIMTLGIMTLGIMTLGIMTLGIMTLGIMTLGIMTLSIRDSALETQH